MIPGSLGRSPVQEQSGRVILNRRRTLNRIWTVAALAILTCCLSLLTQATYGQTEPITPQVDTQVDSLPASDGNSATNLPDSNISSEGESNQKEGLNFLGLLVRGGWFMIPLALLSILVVSLTIERTLALRQDKILPGKFVNELGFIASDEEGFNPRRAYKACQQFPSVGARVVKAMLLKAGRPLPEVENTVAECSQREANKLHNVVSWLTLAAAVAPLIGLLGTVWGITQAFYESTQLGINEDKSDALAEGIYTALVTTMCGLAIAIPAAVMAHIFENRIVSWFNRIDELVLNLTPQLEPLEGKMRAAAEPRRKKRGDPDLQTEPAQQTNLPR